MNTPDTPGVVLVRDTEDVPLVSVGDVTSLHLYPSRNGLPPPRLICLWTTSDPGRETVVGLLCPSFRSRLRLVTPGPGLPHLRTRRVTSFRSPDRFGGDGGSVRATRNSTSRRGCEWYRQSHQYHGPRHYRRIRRVVVRHHVVGDLPEVVLAQLSVHRLEDVEFEEHVTEVEECRKPSEKVKTILEQYRNLHRPFEDTSAFSPRKSTPLHPQVPL